MLDSQTDLRLIKLSFPLKKKKKKSDFASSESVPGLKDCEYKLQFNHQAMLISGTDFEFVN